MFLNRQRAAELGQETARILETGRYATKKGTLVELHDLLRTALAGTCSYPPNYPVPDSKHGEKATQIEVTNETTLAAAGRLVEEGYKPAALNFASAKNPGGGFLTGARAQEESLARSSGLYACLVGNPMYELHRTRPDPMYTHYAIYSPDVPVFRVDDGTLLDVPFLCAFITCPAVNAKVVLERDSSRKSEIKDAMWVRVLKVLGIAAEKRHDAVVLGAWGCGVFGNDPKEIAEHFHRALEERFRGAFTKIFFAVLDRSDDGSFISPFQRIFSKNP